MMGDRSQIQDMKVENSMTYNPITAHRDISVSDAITIVLLLNELATW
jgi:predicted transcriptional regulator